MEFKNLHVASTRHRVAFLIAPEVLRAHLFHSFCRFQSHNFGRTTCMRDHQQLATTSHWQKQNSCLCIHDDKSMPRKSEKLFYSEFTTTSHSKQYPAYNKTSNPQLSKCTIDFVNLHDGSLCLSQVRGTQHIRWHRWQSLTSLIAPEVLAAHLLLTCRF